jgi:NADH-quinone oxidoreductase subunit C
MAPDNTGTSKDDAEPTGGEHSSAEASGTDTAAHRDTGGETPAAGEVEQLDGVPEGGTRVPSSRGQACSVDGTGDTSVRWPAPARRAHPGRCPFAGSTSSPTAGHLP